MNVLEATDLLDNDLSKDEIEFLKIARRGIALYDVDKKVFNSVYDKGLVDTVSFQHVRADSGINGVVLTEEGIKIMNIIDQRYRERPDVSIAAPPVERNSTESPASDAQKTDNHKTIRK